MIPKSTAEEFQVEGFLICSTCTYTQNSFAVVSIIGHLLKTLKEEYPILKQAFLCSDNAGCYKNAALLSLPDICAHSGVKIMRYDFSDPQAGKDVCDRKTAPMKAHIKRWVNEKHDVLPAKDMKQTIKSHEGLKGFRAAVVEVDILKDVVKDKKIPGISLLNNFQFIEEGRT